VHIVNDMLGMHMRELSDLIVPLEGDRDLMVDGYRLLNDRNTIHPLYDPEDGISGVECDPLRLYEPRIGYIRDVLESLLGIIDMEANGETVPVDGFRLKNLKNWLTPGGGAVDILAHAASRCNLNCRFCYNKDAPPALKPELKEPEDEYKEIQERIRQYIPRAKLSIFPDMGSPAEALAHPHILEILKELRNKTDESFRIATNGSTLTLEMVENLVEFQPIYIDVSLNSASASRRKWLMRDPEPQIALKALNLLKNAGIPYTVVIVPWPFPAKEEMISDLQNTVSFAAAFDPALIQISLPGFSRSLSQKETFSHEAVWNDLKIAVQELRSGTDCPLVIRPGLFEEYTDPERADDPVTIGAVKSSPACNAGVQPGDCIVKVNGLPVKNRTQARALLTILHESEMRKASLSIQRNGNNLDLDVDLDRFDYPYTPESATHLGIVFSSSGVSHEWLERIKQIITSHMAEEVLLLSSTLVSPVLKHMLYFNGIFPDVRLHIRIPENRYFGGNIFMGDLMVVEDFIESIEEFISEENIRPDLVIIPSSPFHLSGWGRDLTGRVYLDIERHTKISVALVDCETIYD